MKIALYELLTTVSPGGIQTTYWETARRLGAWGHEVHLYGGEGPIRWEVPETVKIFTFPFTPRSRFPNWGTRFRKAAERASFARHTLPVLLENRYDIIYIRKPFEMPLALYVRRRTGARAVFRSGGTEFFPGYAACARHLDAFLAASRFNAGQITRYCGLKPRVVYNGVDTERFRPLPRSQELRASLGLDLDDLVLITVSRLEGWKGIQFGIQALKLLGDPRVTYLVVGDGRARQELQELAEREGLGRRVIFTGAVDNREVPSYYALGDVALFPTIGDDDAFPNALVEAMACGLPTIGTKKGGIPEGISDGRTGFVIPARDAGALAEKVGVVLINAELRQELGQNARTRAQEHFSWEVIVRELENIFVEAANS